MKRVGGDPALDFVNTVGGRRPKGPAFATAIRDDRLVAYRELVSWARHVGLASAARAQALDLEAQARPREAARVLARARRLREALARVLRALMAATAPPPGDLRAVGAWLAAARGRERLLASARGLRWEPAQAGGLESVLGPLAGAASALLTSADLSRLRECAGDGCGWLFLDTSRNRSRRWCTMQDCGNVSKVRRFRRRQRRGGSPVRGHPRPRRPR
jgi:predicted RNA-binding Zn ribbon-like protein